jgi:hypothetical protein
MKNLFTLTVLCALAFASPAQNFMKHFPLNSFVPADVAVCSAGGYLLSGYSYNNPIWEVALVKTDASGNVQWGKRYTVPNYSNPTAYSIGEVNGGGAYYMFIADYNYYNIYTLVKLDASGNVLWSMEYTPVTWDQLYSQPTVKQHTNGNFIITTSELTRMGLICTDANGNLLWSHTFRNDSTKNPSFASAICNDGGTLTTVKRDNDVQLVKTDAGGNVQWNKIFEYNGTNYSHARDIIKTSDGNLLIGGLEMDLSTNEITGLLMKVDNSGNILWQKDYKPLNTAFPNLYFEKIAELPSGEIIAVGNPLDSIFYGGALIIAKTDASGNLVDSKKVSDIVTNYGSNGLKIAGSQVVFTEYDSQSFFSTDFTLNFACIGTNFPMTVTAAAPPLNIFTGQTSISSVAFTQSAITVTASGFTPQIIDFCSVFSVDEAQNENGITVYPNPGNGIFTISNFQYSITNVEVYNVYGEKIKNIPLNPPSKKGDIDLSSHPAGVYFIRLTTADGQTASARVVKR